MSRIYYKVMVRFTPESMEFCLCECDGYESSLMVLEAMQKSSEGGPCEVRFVKHLRLPE